MKVSELKVGEKYHTRKGRTVIVVDTGYEYQNGGWSTKANRAKKVEKGGTHVAVAVLNYGGGTQWHPDYIAALQIARLAPTAEEIAAGNLKAQHERELAKVRADALQSRVDVATADIRTLLDLHPEKYFSVNGGNVTLTIENLEALLELAKAGAA